jgi:hypothetical protein
MFVVVLVAVGIAGFGYYRGWFVVSTSHTDQQPSATVTVDKTKFREDEKPTSLSPQISRFLPPPPGPEGRAAAAKKREVVARRPSS